MQITATELKLNLGKYLDIVNHEDVWITRNGKMIAKLINPNISSVEYISAGKVSEDIDRHSMREERLARYEIDD